MIQLPFSILKLQSHLTSFSVQMSGSGQTVHIAVNHGVWFHLKGQLRVVCQDLRKHSTSIYPRFVFILLLVLTY